MENSESFKSATGSHPLVTMLVFGGLIAALVGSGSYVSKHRSAARLADADTNAAFSFLEAGR